MSATTFPFTLAAFSAHCPSPFSVSASAPVSLTLTEAQALDAESPDQRRFSLIFAGPHAPALAQATYTLEHTVLGSLAIFLVPIARDADGMRYQAIFN